MKNSTKVIGLDLSLVGTGKVTIDTKNYDIKCELIKSSPCEKLPLAELKRLCGITNKIGLCSSELVVIEGLSYSMRNTTSLLQLAGLNYFVRQNLFLNKIPFVIVAPTTLKKFITGKGNSKKDVMLLETYKRYKKSFDNDNLCDAYGLAQIGLAILGKNENKLISIQDEVVNLLKPQLIN